MCLPSNKHKQRTKKIPKRKLKIGTCLKRCHTEGRKEEHDRKLRRKSFRKLDREAGDKYF
jgi:hypothetical protein